LRPRRSPPEDVYTPIDGTSSEKLCFEPVQIISGRRKSFSARYELLPKRYQLQPELYRLFPELYLFFPR
jgi:hypothetical protein